MKTGLNLFATL